VQSTNPAVLNLAVNPAELDNLSDQTYSIFITNPYPDSTTFNLSGSLYPSLLYKSGSETGGLAYNPSTREFSARKSLAGATTRLELSGDAPLYVAGVPAPGLDLTSYCKASGSLSPNCDNIVYIVRGFNFTYMGLDYTSVKISSNGYLVPGTPSVNAAAAIQKLPSPAFPNNIIAPLWSDLEFANADAMWLIWVTDTHTVIEWRHANLRGSPTIRYDFEIWIETGTNNITFAYGTLDADISSPTSFGYSVGAENPDGSAGASYYHYDAVTKAKTGTPPVKDKDLNLVNNFSTSKLTFDATASLPASRDPLISQLFTLLNSGNDWIVQATAYAMINIYPVFAPWVSRP
jgi:hypothetical protein